MSEQACIKTERDGAIARVELHQPARRNAMRFTMWRDLGETMESLADDSAVRVVVLSGAGDKAFSAGADISEFDEMRSNPETTARYDKVSHHAMHVLEHFPKPVLGRIQGFCVGGGFELALACDIRIAADNAQFAVTPARLGLGYGLADTRLLVSRLGDAAVREILLTARVFNADEALRLGIVSKVTSADALDAAIDEYAQRIAANAPLTLKASKAIIHEAGKSHAESDAALCKRLVDDCFSSEDYAEGRRAFAEKRRPQFTGR